MAKGIWGLLQKAGVIEVSDDPIEGAKPADKPITSPPQPSAIKVETVEERKQIAEIDTMVREQLANAMADSGAKLVEELGDLLETLGESIPDEKLRYSTAIKILNKKGSSVSAICNDIDRCIGVLEQKDREFNATLNDQFNKRVGGKTQQAAACEEQIAVKRSQIDKLQSEIAELNVQHGNATAGIVEEKEKLEQVKNRFQTAYVAMRNEIDAQRAKITQYGEGA